jgi:hypothetical protein
MSFFHMHLGESQNLLAQFAYEIFSGWFHLVSYFIQSILFRFKVYLKTWNIFPTSAILGRPFL